MTYRTSSTVRIPVRRLAERDETSTQPSEISTTGGSRRARWMHEQADRIATVRQRGRLFFVAALLAMLVAVGFATTSSTHVLERATLAQQVEEAPAAEESAEPLRLRLERIQ